jgi:hypothetical protein
MRLLKSIFLGICLMALAVPAMAQGVQTGSIEGAVVDSDGVALPGVHVAVTGANLLGQRTAITGAGGIFRFPVIPPGDYNMVFTLEGFNTVQHSGLPVYVGNATQVDTTMDLSEFGDTIEVTADRVVVDTTKSTVDYSLTFDELDKLATNRNYTEVLSRVPGVQPGNNPAVQGNAGAANQYLVDGVDTTDVRVGTWGTALNFDTIAEVQVMTAGQTAEYGRAVGGTMNVVTRSGGNDFHGTFRWVEARSEWASEWDEGKSGGGRTDEARPIVTLGGPILRDRLWFFAAYEERDNSRGFSWYENTSDAIEGVLTQGRTSYAGHYLSGKLTFQPHENHNFVTSFVEDPITLSPLARGWGGPGNHEDVEREQFQGGWNGSIQWTGVFTDEFFMSARGQITRQELNVAPDSPTWGTEIPFITDQVVGYNTGAPPSHYQSFRYRDGLIVDGTFFKEIAGNSHEFKTGIEYAAGDFRGGAIRNPAGQYLTNLGVPYRRQIFYDQTGVQENPDDYWAIYLQDEWRLGNLTLNLGVRAESEKLFNNANDEIVSFGFGERIAPRLGFAYDLNGNSINGSLGRFYYPTTTYVASYFNVQTDRLERAFWNETCDPTALEIWEYPEECWDVAFDIPIGVGGYELDPNLNPAYQDVLTLGYRHRINDEMAAGVTFVWREQDSQIDVYDPEAAGDYFITNVPKTSDFGSGVKWSEYQAIMLDFEKRFSDDRISITSNYTYSFEANAWSGAWFRDLLLFTFTNPEAIDPNWYGRTESPHTFRFFGSYICPWDMVVGLTAFWNSGTAYTPFNSGEYGLVPAAERGSARVGNNWEGNLYIEQPFTIGPVSVAVYANVFNMFDNQQPTGVQTRTYLSTYREPTAWQAPRSYQLGFRLEF